MPGRHASAHANAPRGRFALTIVVVAAVVGAAVFGVRALLDARADPCGAAPATTVAADPAIAAVVADLAESYEAGVRDGDDECVQLEVSGRPGPKVAATIGTPDAPDLWIPDSSLWTRRLGDVSSLESIGQVATSPLVVVAPRPAAGELGWPDEEFSWQVVLGNDDARITDPGSTTEGLAGVLAVQASLGEANERERVGALAALARASVPSVDEAYQALADNEAMLFTGTEQSVIAYNSGTEDDGVVAIYPEEGTVALDFPALAVRRGDETGPAAHVAEFVEYLGTAGALEQIRAAGFRSPDGEAAESAGVVDGTQPGMPDLLPELDAETVNTLLQQWDVISRDMRMLTVIDVSGSMNAAVPSGGTRIEVTRDAARSAIELLSPNSEVGLWVFSVLLDPPDHHHLELAPLKALNEPVDGGQHVDTVLDGLETLPDQVGGATALYDTTLAAFEYMRETYAAEKVNSVVLMTDGRDEDNPASIGLEHLLQRLQDQFDPDAPVPVITIGIGPDADMDALQQISEATGTTAYRAEEANDINDVFTRAMIERLCRPDC